MNDTNNDSNVNVNNNNTNNGPASRAVGALDLDAIGATRLDPTPSNYIYYI